MGGGVWTWGVESGRVLRLPAAAVLEEGAGRGAGRDARAANTGPTVSSLFPQRSGNSQPRGDLSRGAM